MHIPDGYLSPQTYLPAYAAMAALWAWASQRVGRTLRMRQVPLLALGAAFSFVIMMVNIPIPGGTTGHAVGAVLIAILLGPWAAVIAVSLALIVQALIFGDGGITAVGANCFNIAVVMPFAGWWIYRLIAGQAPAGSRRQLVAAAAGGYVGINAAALATAVMLGIQPLIARGADGLALYNPFGLKVAVPVMMVEHLLLFGLVEAVVTALVLTYVARTDPSLLPRAAPRRMQAVTRMAIVLGVLVVLTPIGLFLPAAFNAGDAWGEWAPEDVPAQFTEHTGQPGYIPGRMERLNAIWQAPLPDYALPGLESAPLWQLSLVYIGCGFAGVLALWLLIVGLGKLFSRKEPDDLTPGVDVPAGRA
jgi:cobalt/nickel transport system permease protein